MILVQLLVEFAKRARMPVQSAADWMLRPGRERLIAAADIDTLIEEVLGEGPQMIPYVGSRFIIVNMTDVWFELELERDMFQRTDPEAPGPASLSENPSPEVCSFLDVLNQAGTALVVDLSAIELTVCDRVRAERMAYASEHGGAVP